MPISASKSIYRRETSASSTKPSSSATKQQSSADSRKKIPLRRSKSVNAVSRSYIKVTEEAASDPSAEQLMNKRDNPLFLCSSPSSPEHEGGDDGCSVTRGRSVSRSFSNVNLTSGNRNQLTRSLSRGGSEGRLQALSREYFNYFERDEDGDFRENLSQRNERNGTYEPKIQKNNDATSSGHGILEQTKNLQTWSSRHPVCDCCNTASCQIWEDEISTSSLSALEETPIGEHDPSARGGIGCIYETVRSEVQRAVSEMKNDLENVIWRKNFMLHASDSIVDMGPDLVNPDTLELVSDIRMEYETKLKESHERARKLRADLAVEEQREQEISRMLKEIIPDENSAPRKSRPRRKLSIERLRMSRRLAEDAMSYFDECVSISTFDGSDFSSTEDQQPSSIGIIPPVNGNRSLPSDASTYTTPCTLNDHLNYQEEVEIQLEWSVGAAESSLAEISCCSSSQVASLPLEGQKHDKVSNLVALHGGSIEISSACEAAAASGGCHDFRNYIKRFEKKTNKSAKHAEVTSSFNQNDYDLDNSAENLLLDIVIFKNRIESGSLLLCNIRTF